MSNVWFISDIHAGHSNIVKYRLKQDGDSYESEREHFHLVKDNYHKLVHPKDPVYFLGDIAFDLENLYDVAGWVGKKYLIVGNHDKDNLTMRQIVEYGGYEDIFSLKKKYGAWLSHAPLHESELRGKINVHGHTHYDEVDDPRYMNVCLEHTDMCPISLDEIRKKYKERGIDI